MRLTLPAIALVFASSATAATVIPVGAFRSVELRSGGHVVLRHGAVQRVSVIKGDLHRTRVRVEGNQRLVIDRSADDCHAADRLEIEVVTPNLVAVAVSNGGTIQANGSFPAQHSIAVRVEQGGTIDIRPIAADTVDASVESGGRIFTTSRKTLSASVESGGVITHWGATDIREHVRDGGVVTRGAAGDAGKPLSSFGPELAPVPPVPPIPPS